MKKNTSVKLLLILIIFFNPVSGARDISNQPPEAYFIVSPSSGQAPLTVNFDASGSYDIDGTIASYSWNFGDGETGNGKSVSHIYKRADTYYPKLTVTDNRGLSSNPYSTRLVFTVAKALYVTITSSQITVGPGEESIISVDVTGKDGLPVSGATVKLIPTGAAKVSPQSGATDSSGHFASTFSAPLGNQKISVLATKESFFPSSGETIIKVVNKRQLSVVLSSEPASVGAGNPAAIKVTVTRNDGTPVPDATVVLVSDPGGSFSPESGQTDMGGQFISTFRGAEAGKVTVKATVTKQGFTDGSGEIPVDVPASFNYFLPVVIVLAIIGAGGVYFRTEGKLQVIPVQNSVPCDGKSTLPIKVQFIDPSGRLVVHRRNMVVELCATSGTIQNVAIPAGKEFAETVLTSSNECGPVIVTAKSGIQKVKVEVNFVAKEAALCLEISPLTVPADGISISSIVIKTKDDRGNYVASLGDRTVELTTTLGTIISPVTIPAGAVSGVAILTSGKTCGTATVTASMGSFRGEGKVNFIELAERYCMHCGAAMKRDMKNCPECKKRHPADNEVKTCYSCSAVLPSSADFCDKCGAKQPA